MDRVELAVRCLDLTSLSDEDTDEGIRELCARAMEPAVGVPHVAAVCVSPRFARFTSELLRGSGVRLAVATGAFPSGVLSMESRVREIGEAIDAGADEIDTVMDHRAFLEGRAAEVRTQLEASREACGDRTMKVILETGALPDAGAIRRAAELAIDAGADFVKSSTGKVGPGVTSPAARAMCEAVRDSGRSVGVKLSGGVRTSEQALGHLSTVDEVLGSGWLTPERFRIGASSLLVDLVRRLVEPTS